MLAHQHQNILTRRLNTSFFISSCHRHRSDFYLLIEVFLILLGGGIPPTYGSIWSFYLLFSTSCPFVSFRICQLEPSVTWCLVGRITRMRLTGGARLHRTTVGTWLSTLMGGRASVRWSQRNCSRSVLLSCYDILRYYVYKNGTRSD